MCKRPVAVSEVLLEEGSQLASFGLGAPWILFGVWKKLAQRPNKVPEDTERLGREEGESQGEDLVRLVHFGICSVQSSNQLIVDFQ